MRTCGCCLNESFQFTFLCKIATCFMHIIVGYIGLADGARGWVVLSLLALHCCGGPANPVDFQPGCNVRWDAAAPKDGCIPDDSKFNSTFFTVRRRSNRCVFTQRSTSGAGPGFGQAATNANAGIWCAICKAMGPSKCTAWTWNGHANGSLYPSTIGMFGRIVQIGRQCCRRRRERKDAKTPVGCSPCRLEAKARETQSTCANPVPLMYFYSEVLYYTRG